MELEVDIFTKVHEGMHVVKAYIRSGARRHSDFVFNYREGIVTVPPTPPLAILSKRNDHLLL